MLRVHLSDRDEENEKGNGYIDGSKRQKPDDQRNTEKSRRARK